MNFTFKNTVSAVFQLRTFGGSRSSTSGKSPNMVLDSGLVRMGQGAYINRVCVGTGNKIVEPTDTGLNAFLVSTTTRLSWSVVSMSTNRPYKYTVRVVYRFGEGVAKGNLTEIGLGWDDTALWNRALILDSESNPTTLTILEDEFLDVTADITYTMDETIGSFQLLDKRGGVVSTHTYRTMPFLWASDKIMDFGTVCINFIGVNTTHPSSPTDYASPYANPARGHTTTANTVSAKVSIPLTYAGSIKCLVYVLSGMGYSRQSNPTFAPTINVLFDPPITKTNAQEWEISGTFQYARG